MLRSWAKYKTNIETQEKVLVERKPQWPRYNIFSQQIEFTPPYGSQKGKMVACEGEYALDRVYLHLADQNYKISKEVAADCFVQAARENVYDPVKEYLENCLKGPSESIDILATTYLRPEDDLSDGPTIYDQMLKCTLIAAVATSESHPANWSPCFAGVRSSSNNMNSGPSPLISAKKQRGVLIVSLSCKTW